MERWERTLYAIRQRCNNPNWKNFHRYGGRGIKCLITKGELKRLWFQCDASQMVRPSIDRFDNNGDYVIGNCRYIELKDNARKRENTRRKTCPKGHPYSGNNLYINETPQGWKLRVCRECSRESRRKHNKKVGSVYWREYRKKNRERIRIYERMRWQKRKEVKNG